MIALLAALLAQTTVPEPTRKPSGVDLATLTKTVSEVCRKEIVYGSLQLETKYVTIHGGEGATVDEIFNRYQQALLTNGYALIRDPQSKNRYNVVRLGMSLPFLPEEFTEIEKLPKGEEIVTLTLRLTTLTAGQVLKLVGSRLNPTLLGLQIQTVESISLTDLASTLLQVGKLIQNLDKYAAETTKPIEVEFWLVNVDGSEDNRYKPLQDKDVEAALRAKSLLREQKVPAVFGMGRGRLNPSFDSGSRGTVSLNLETISFRAEIQRGKVHLFDFKVVGSGTNPFPTLYQADHVIGIHDKMIVLTAWGAQGSTILVFRTRIGE